jgi:CCR4-NOT transcription complex subunit 1
LFFYCRVLLERLVANRPHPWGLLITFLELVRNPNLKLWSREFMSISPDVKRFVSSFISLSLSDSQESN